MPTSWHPHWAARKEFTHQDPELACSLRQRPVWTLGRGPLPRRLAEAGAGGAGPRWESVSEHGLCGVGLSGECAREGRPGSHTDVGGPWGEGKRRTALLSGPQCPECVRVCRESGVGWGRSPAVSPQRARPLLTEMVATRQQMNDAQLTLQQRDYCAHYLIRLLKCKRDSFPNFLACKHEQHDWDYCEHLE